MKTTTKEGLKITTEADRKRVVKRIRAAVKELNAAFEEAVNAELDLKLQSYVHDWGLYYCNILDGVKGMTWMDIEEISYHPEQPSLPDKKIY